MFQNYFCCFFFSVSVLLSKMLVPSRQTEAEAATGGCTVQIIALKNFANFTEKQLCWSFVLIISCKPEAKGKFAQTSKSIKTSWTWLSAKILLLFMSLLTTLIVKNSHILARTFFNFLKKRPTPKLKGFQYQIWTSVKKPGK